MTTYALYLESGPQRRKTMVHALDLLGCVAVGPTTGEALAATPDAIRTFQRFLRRHGEPEDVEAPIETQVAEHVTQGDWLGNGSPYLIFGPDLEPIGEEEMERLLQRFRWMREEMAAWTATQSGAQLDEPFQGGRAAVQMSRHDWAVHAEAYHLIRRSASYPPQAAANERELVPGIPEDPDGPGETISSSSRARDVWTRCRDMGAGTIRAE